MKGGFLNKAIARDADVPVPKTKSPGMKQWDEQTIEVMVQVLQDVLMGNNMLARNDLERRVRSGTGAKEFRGRCCGAPAAPVDQEDDVAAQYIREHTKPSALRDMVGPIMEQVATLFGRVKERGKNDGLVMDAETESKVRKDVLKECLIRHILGCINADNSGTQASGSSDAGLLATPQGYFGGDLNSFSGDAIRGLMQHGFGIQDDWMEGSVVDDICNELEYLDFDGKLMEVQQQKMTGHRTDRICWLTYEGLDREKQPGLTKLFKKMISIPFELNKKCSLYLQASASFQMACYAPQGYYKKHVDGGYNDLNNGRKITAIYFANKSWSSSNGGELRMHKRKPNPFEVAKGIPDCTEDEIDQDIEPQRGRLVVFRSRDMPHAVMPCKHKRYAVSLWLMGPPGPGDQPDAHYTPT